MKRTEDVPPIHVTFLRRPDVEDLQLTDHEIIDPVDRSLVEQGLGPVAIEPRVHLTLDPAVPGHFNVLLGAIVADIRRASRPFVLGYRPRLRHA
ncbi:MAG: hypothetical protein ABWZ80_03605 [Beijerinckiaceae bacterium]